MHQPRTYSITIPSDRASIMAVEPFLRSIDELQSLGQRYHDVLVAVTEAVNNAIIHGNGCDASKPVTLDVQTTDADIVILVADRGTGFDPDSVPDPRHPDRLLQEGGRGVFLIRHLADVVEFYHREDGMTVLIKYVFN